MMTFSRKDTSKEDERAAALAREVAVVRDLVETCGPVMFGAPMRCPACGDFAVIDNVFDSIGVQENRCLHCLTTWILTRRAITRFNAEMAAGTSAQEPLHPTRGRRRVTV